MHASTQQTHPYPAPTPTPTSTNTHTHTKKTHTPQVTFPMMQHLCGLAALPPPPALLSTPAAPGALHPPPPPPPALDAPLLLHPLPAPPAGASGTGAGTWSAAADDAHPLMRAAAAAREGVAEELGLGPEAGALHAAYS